MITVFYEGGVIKFLGWDKPQSFRPVLNKVTATRSSESHPWQLQSLSVRFVSCAINAPSFYCGTARSSNLPLPVH